MWGPCPSSCSGRFVKLLIDNHQRCSIQMWRKAHKSLLRRMCMLLALLRLRIRAVSICSVSRSCVSVACFGLVVAPLDVQCSTQMPVCGAMQGETLVIAARKLKRRQQHAFGHAQQQPKTSAAAAAPGHAQPGESSTSNAAETG